MVWKKKRNKPGKNRYYSVSKLLRRKNKTTPQFEVMLNSLTLEELIALKLELAAKASGSPVYGIPIWKNLTYITRQSVLKFAQSACRSNSEAALFLGMNVLELVERRKKYKTDLFFEQDVLEDED